MQKLKLQAYIKRSTGSALVTSLVMGVVFSIIGITAIRISTHGSDIARRDLDTIKSYWANEGYMRLALRAISLDPGSNGRPSDNLTGAITEQLTISGDSLKLNDCELGVNSSITITHLDSCLGVYNIEVRTKRDVFSNNNNYNVTRLDSVAIKSIQRYTFFEDQTADTGILWRDFVVHGDFHSNGIIRIASDATDEVHVEGEATSSGACSPVETSYPIPYDKGITIKDDNVSKLKKFFPQYAHVGDIQTDFLSPDAFDDSYYLKNASNVPYTEPIAIELDPSQGSSPRVKIYKKSGSQWIQITTGLPTSDIIKTNSETYVWGTLKGALTIVTNTGNNIVIGGDISYNSGIAPGSSDALALVSGQNIVVPNSFNLVVGGVSKYQHDFRTVDSEVYGCLFMKTGGLTVADIDGYTQVESSDLLNKLTVYGCVLVQQDLDKLWEFENSNFGGLRCIYMRDNRYYCNHVAPPGIPFPKAFDEERSTVGVPRYMWVLAYGTWKNRIE